MSDDLKVALQRAASEVFEELTFMLPKSDVDDARQNAPFQMASAVEFWGPVSGRLVVAIYGNLVPMITANMLGDMESPTEFQQRDAIKELANVICGNMLPNLIGEEAVYKIDAPSVIETLDVTGPFPAHPMTQFEVAMEAGKVDVQLFLYRNPPVEPQA